MFLPWLAWELDESKHSHNRITRTLGLDQEVSRITQAPGGLHLILTKRWRSQSVLKEISPEYSLEGLMLKLKFQYFGHLMRRTDSLEKTLMLAKIEGWRRG